MDYREVYFTLVHDSRAQKREEALRQLVESGDQYLKRIAEAGAAIAKVVCEGADAKTLGEAAEKLSGLPMSDYWKKYLEVSGQVLIDRGLAMERSEKRSAILESGMKLMAGAMSGGFPLSDASIELVKKARDAEPALQEAAGSIVVLNSHLIPSEEFPEAREKKKRPAGFRPTRKAGQ
jgi:hypothetical protein